MNIILISYLFVVGGWMVLLVCACYRPKAIPDVQHIMWLWFGVSVVLFIAWRFNTLWLALLSTVLALVGISKAGSLMQQWLRREVGGMGLLVWCLWGGTLSLLLAQLFVVWLNSTR